MKSKVTQTEKLLRDAQARLQKANAETAKWDTELRNARQDIAQLKQQVSALNGQLTQFINTKAQLRFWIVLLIAGLCILAWLLLDNALTSAS